MTASATSNITLCLLLLLLPTNFFFPWPSQTHCTSSLPLVDALALPSIELINRRKSPALWREDLQEQNEINGHVLPQHPQHRRLLVRPPQVMAPAGGWPQLHAAIANGADAVYVGLSSFSARARAANFSPQEELPLAVQTCHQHGVKLYVALNTLVFPHELPEIEALLRQCYRARVDAVIVQDLGVARLAAQVVPRLHVHASTQQSITSADGALFAAHVGNATRVVVGRELSVVEIEAVTRRLEWEHNTNHNNEDDGDGNHHHPVEVEAFVHGALCVSYSGQCFSSEAWGGRSANRGQCAQACRLPYGLVSDGQLVELGDFSYLLSPQDLCGLDHVPALLRAGVSCLKIEGRLKDAPYVAATTRAYRHAVDRAWRDYLGQQQQQQQGEGENDHHATPSLQKTRQLSVDGDVSRHELAQLFSRGQDENHDGLTPGFFEGSMHQRLVRGRSPRHRGVHVGRVMEGSSWKHGLLIALDNNSHDDDNDDTVVQQLKRGDGIVVDRGLAQEEELGGPIFDVQIVSKGGSASTRTASNGKPQSNDRRDHTTVRVRFSEGVEKKWKELDDQARKHGTAAVAHAPVGAHVWKTSDATVEKKMKRFVEAPPPRKLASVQVTGRLGKPLEVKIRDNVTGLEGVGQTDGTLQSAEKSGLSRAEIQKAIGSLGNTEWTLGVIDTSGLEDGVWCPASWIKEARRMAVEHLESFSNDLDNTVDSFNSEMGEGQQFMLQKLLEASSKEKTTKVDESDETNAARAVKVSVLARNYNQVDKLCTMVERGDAVIDEIIVDFLEVDGMREAVSRIRETNSTKAVVASPRIIKPGESGIWRTLLRLEPDGLLVRSTGLLLRMIKLGGAGSRVNVGGTTHLKEQHMVTIPEIIGDFSLNVANALTAWELLQYGCSRVTASFDLNSNGVTELLHSMGGIGVSQVDIVAHAHLPIFHTEHCIFARFLSSGKSYLDCGHACTRHNVHLRDQSGADNLVLADMGCRNTVFSSEAQSGVHSLKEWVKAGATRFRIELVDEVPDDVELVVRGYQAVLDRRMRAGELWESLKDVRDSNGRTGGVSLGSLRNTNVRRAGEIQ